MDRDTLKLKPAPSFRRRFQRTASTSTATSSDGDSETDNLSRYTSLKDIILNSSPKHATGNNEPGNISIRNELVKHAASAYVLSATIISPPSTGQDWFPFGDGKNISCVDLHSCWEIHVTSPLQDLYQSVVDFFIRVFIG